MSKKVKEPIVYTNITEIKDNRQFIFGTIWQIRDSLITIPNADRLRNRKYHFTRCVVIIDNSAENFNGNSPLISVAPISSQVHCKRKFDIELDKEDDEVLKDSIIMLDYIQPVLKKDLYKCVGDISEDKKYELIESVMIKMGLPTLSEVAVAEANDNN